MPTPQALEALKILAGGGMGQRVLPSEAYGFGGRIPTQGELESPFEQEQAQRASAADAVDRAAIGKIQAMNAGVTEYNRPDVQAVREQEEQDALKRLVLPIQVKGAYDVAAAREHAQAAAANTQALIGGRQQVAETNQAGINNRTAANLKSQALRQRYQAVATGKEKAPVGFFEGFVPSMREAAQHKLLAEIQAQIDAADGEVAAGPAEGMPAAAAPTGGESPAARMARLRAAMGR